MTSLPATATQRLLADAHSLCQVISAIHGRGWCDGTGGNFSTVLCNEPLTLLMAPSGVDKGSLQPADLIVVNAEAQVIAGNGKASAETLLHLAIIATTNAGSVLHTHSQAATLLSRLQPPKDTCNKRSTESQGLSTESQTLPSSSHGLDTESQTSLSTSQGLSTKSQTPLASSQDPSAKSQTLPPSSQDPSVKSQTPSPLRQDPSAKSQTLPSSSQDPSAKSQTPPPSSQDPSVKSQALPPSSQGLLVESQTRSAASQERFVGLQRNFSTAQFLYDPDELSNGRSLLGHLRLANLEMLKGLEGIRSHATSIAIPILANSQDMRQLSQDALPHLATAPHGMLIAGHGLYAWGDSLAQARRHLEILEFLLEQHWREHLFNTLLSREGISQ